MDTKVTDEYPIDNASALLAQDFSEKEEPSSEFLRCKVCGRSLKNENSRKIGMGPTCLHRYLNRPNHKKLF